MDQKPFDLAPTPAVAQALLADRQPVELGQPAETMDIRGPIQAEVSEPRQEVMPALTMPQYKPQQNLGADYQGNYNQALDAYSNYVPISQQHPFANAAVNALGAIGAGLNHQNYTPTNVFASKDAAQLEALKRRVEAAKSAQDEAEHVETGNLWRDNYNQVAKQNHLPSASAHAFIDPKDFLALASHVGIPDANAAVANWTAQKNKAESLNPGVIRGFEDRKQKGQLTENEFKTGIPDGYIEVPKLDLSNINQFIGKADLPDVNSDEGQKAGIAAMEDITKTKEAEAKLKQAEDDLAIKNAGLAQTAAQNAENSRHDQTVEAQGQQKLDLNKKGLDDTAKSASQTNALNLLKLNQSEVNNTQTAAENAQRQLTALINDPKKAANNKLQVQAATNHLNQMLDIARTAKVKQQGALDSYNRIFGIQPQSQPEQSAPPVESKPSTHPAAASGFKPTADGVLTLHDYSIPALTKLTDAQIKALSPDDKLRIQAAFNNVSLSRKK